MPDCQTNAEQVLVLTRAVDDLKEYLLQHLREETRANRATAAELTTATERLDDIAKNMAIGRGVLLALAAVVPTLWGFFAWLGSIGAFQAGK